MTILYELEACCFGSRIDMTHKIAAICHMFLMKFVASFHPGPGIQNAGLSNM
jgi:hypothetical protein